MKAAPAMHAIDIQPRVPTSCGAIEKVAESIIRGIRSGFLVPGQHLSEPELTALLGISRGSLREALKQLSTAGIVTLNRFRGAYISTLDRQTTLDLLDVLEPLARLAARLAAEHCDDETKRRRMQDAEAAVRAAHRSLNKAQYLEQRRAFYTVLIDIGGNRELERAMPLTRADLFRAQAETVKTVKQRADHVAGYGKVAAAIIKQNPTSADRAVQRHFAATRQTIRELPPGAFPQAEC
jgi:DNA-binding GntR family transcriptional regulator